MTAGREVARAVDALRRGWPIAIGGTRFLAIETADEAGLAELKPMLSGPTAVATGSGDEVALARSVLDALRPYSRVVKVRGGVIGRRMIGADDLQRLSTMPSREVLLGRLGGGMQAPIAALAAVLAGNLRNLVGVLNAVAEKKQQQSAPPAGGAAAES